MLDLTGDADNCGFPVRESRARKEASKVKHDPLAEFSPVCK
jgi:hypothetical protein